MALQLPPPPPPPDKKASTREPLGVPADYRVAKPVDPKSVAGGTFTDSFNVLGGKPTASMTAQVAPRYFTGDDLLPASLAPEKIVAMQKAMVAVGLIGPKTKFRVGVWDEATRNGYKNLLEFANVYGVDEKEALRMYSETEALDASGGGAGAGTAAVRAPLVTKVSNPDDLRATFETVARAKMGRRLAPGEAERFVKAYQAQEAGTQKQAYDLDETGGTVTDVANPQAFLAAKLAKEYGAETHAHDLSEQFGGFGDLLKEVGG